jgi:hypothetical protein
MFAALQASPAVSLDALVAVAQAFTPRFQVMGPFVLLDVGGLSALFGSASELGAALRAQRPDCRSMALASTASRALLLACGRPGLTVLAPADEPAAVAALPLEVLVEVAQARIDYAGSRETGVALRHAQGDPEPSRRVGSRDGARDGKDEHAGHRASSSIGWRHPRDTHQAQHTRRPRASGSSSSSARASRALARPLVAIEQYAAALGRWGIRTVGALAALPRPAVHARLGEMGVSWQHLASGEDDEPLVPWVAEPVFEETLELEWPVEGFEPLSFVLARLFERWPRRSSVPIAARCPFARRCTSPPARCTCASVAAAGADVIRRRSGHWCCWISTRTRPARASTRSPSASSRRPAASCSTRCSSARSPRPSNCPRSSHASPRSSARAT